MMVCSTCGTTGPCLDEADVLRIVADAISASAPISGWNEPRWTVAGLPEALTLMPSLGCPRWRTGECIGHWWARSGQLVLA